jgi:hypothetical protein
MSVLDLFLPSATAKARARRVPAAARAAVLGTPEDAAALAAALALSLRAADRAPAAAVATWTSAGTTVRREAATRAAARLAARLAGDDETAAAARGRLAWLALPAEPDAAAAALRRASTLVDGPLVTALGGARPARLDELVAEHDLAVVAADPASALAAAALAGLAGRGVAAVACRPLRRGLPRALALAGVAAPRLDHVLRYGREEP